MTKRSFMAEHAVSRRRVLAGAGTAAIGTMALAGRSSAQQPPFELYGGRWGAALRNQGAAIRLILDIEPNERGTLDAVLTSIDQGGEAFVAEDLSIKGQDVSIYFPKISAVTLLALSEDRSVMTGLWNQGCDRPIVFHREPDIASLAPAPAAPLSEAGLEAFRLAAGSPALAAARRWEGGAGAGLAVGKRSALAAPLATLDDLWHIGSITKSMTATLAALAVEAGAVGWDETLAQLLAPMPVPDAYAGVTLVHLLSHQAGLAPNLPIPELMAYLLEEADPRGSRQDYVAKALAQAPSSAPGAGFVYSNSGYVVAAAALEARLGAPWEALISEKLFTPLSMGSAGFGAPDPGPDADAPTQPIGHAASVGALIGASRRRRPHRPGTGRTDNPAVLGPAGRVRLTLGDLLSFLDAHRSRSGLLQPESWERLQTPPFGGDYAMGWFVKPDGALWHNGSNTLWYAEASVDRQAGVVAAAAANDGVLACSGVAVGEALASARVTP